MLGDDISETYGINGISQGKEYHFGRGLSMSMQDTLPQVKL